MSVMKYPDETKEWFSGHRCVRLSDTRGLFCKANRGVTALDIRSRGRSPQLPSFPNPSPGAEMAVPACWPCARYSLPDPVWPYYSPVWSRSLRS